MLMGVSFIHRRDRLRSRVTKMDNSQLGPTEGGFRTLPGKSTLIGFLLTVSGIVGIVYSLFTAQSDYDPIAFGIATVSILLAIIGIALIFRSPPGDKQAIPT